MKSVLKILYAGLFVLVLPAALAAWAEASSKNIALPVLHLPIAGTLLIAAGVTVMGMAVYALKIYGDGLPMSPFPPTRFVHQSLYRWVPHPLYAGFCVTVFGWAAYTGSAGGLWLVAPTVAAACVAFVWGYERHKLRERFSGPLPASLIRLPAEGSERPSAWDRVSVIVLVYVPWLVAYEMTVLAGVAPDAVDLNLPSERQWPVLVWTELVYASTYPFVFLAPFIASRRGELRWFAVRGWWATVGITAIYWTVPVIAPPRPVTEAGWMADMLRWERTLDSPAAAFPSFHVVWALLAARLYAKPMGRLSSVAWVWAGAIGISCVTTGMHALLDVLAGAAAYIFLSKIEVIWEGLRKWAERMANGWKEWNIGRMRVINHGFYVGVGAFTGMVIIGALLGARHPGIVFLTGMSSLVGAALWAQAVEGSSVLLRPFGYYGGVIGAMLGIGLAQVWGMDGWLLLAAFAVAAPWIQFFGRIRCLIQGCCHGRAAPEWMGIRYRHERSRVTRLTDLRERPVVPTPLFSMLWNVLCGALLLRMWAAGAGKPFTAGMYLILAGLGRFVEEAYRGEPQTRIVGGLRLYQWMAILSVGTGAALTTVGHNMQSPSLSVTPVLVVWSLAFGVVTWFAMGVDSPLSNRRFSRLT